ncbi:hypothetical protein OIU84_012482 [Salix udensis]|uniref:Uncharacterized protein n=1 Tax=Salix udensis TaxID=889485 RepID=A0AAD6JFP2_9ROSI|nr:hypothetical protein OIU84_012482 [Salix udensis]
MASTMIAAAASSYMAATAIRTTRCSALPYLRPRSSSSQSFPIKHVSLSGISFLFARVNEYKEEDKTKQIPHANNRCQLLHKIVNNQLLVAPWPASLTI